MLGGAIDYEFTNCRVGNYVIVCANTKEDSLKRPFWVGQICDNAPDKNKLKVHWLLLGTSWRRRYVTDKLHESGFASREKVLCFS